MKKTISILVIFAFVLSFLPAGSKVLAAQPGGTMTGTAISVDIGQISAINALTVTDSGAEVLNAKNLCIKIPDAVNAIWDVADVTTAAYGGAAAAKASTTVSYVGTKILRIDISADFTNGQDLVISGLSYIGQTAASAVGTLQWAVDSATGDCSDGTYKNATTGGTITVADGAEDTLTSVTLTPSATTPSTSVNYTVAFTIPANGVLPKNGKIKVTFSGIYDVSAVTAGAVSLGAGASTVALTKSGQVVTLTLQNDGVNSTAGAKTAIINGVLNPVAGGYSTATVATTTAADAALASATSGAFYTASVTTANITPPAVGTTINFVTPAATPPSSSTPVSNNPAVSKPISEMTTAELTAKIAEVQQAIITLLQQLIANITEELKGVSH